MEGELKQQPLSKLFVGGLKRTTTGQELEKHFQQYGQVKDAFIVHCKQTAQSRGFGFVEFEDPSAAELALRDQHIILGRKVDVCEPQEKKTDNNETAARDEGESPRRSKRVFVGGLPSTITTEEFKSSFQSFGAVSDAVVVYDEYSGEPRGFGFITFGSEDSADRALNNRFHRLNGSLVEVKRANPKHNNVYNDYVRGGYHEYSALAALNYSFYVNSYYHYWYSHFYQHTSGVPYYGVPPPGMVGNYYNQSCYPVAAANCASLSGGWSSDPVNAVLDSCGETDIVVHHQEEEEKTIIDENGLKDHAWETLRNLDEVNDDHSVNQQGVDSEIRITRSAIHDGEETGSEHHDEQVWRNPDGINNEWLDIKTGGGKHLEAAADGKLDEAESGIGNLLKSETAETGELADGGNAEVVSAVVTYSIENRKVDGTWSMERKPILMESLVPACIQT